MLNGSWTPLFLIQVVYRARCHKAKVDVRDMSDDLAPSRVVRNGSPPRISALEPPGKHHQRIRNGCSAG